MFCQNCGETISESDFDREFLTALCRNCNYISDYSSMAEHDGNITAISQKNTVPEGLEVEESGTMMVIKYRESKGLEIAAWISLLIFEIFIIYAIFFYEQDLSFLYRMLIFLFHQIITGLIPLSFLLYACYNKIIIEANNCKLIITSKPLPFPGYREFPVKDMKNFYCKEEHGHGEYDHLKLYRLIIVMNNNKEIRSSINYNKPEPVVFIKNKLKNFLKIQEG